MKNNVKKTANSISRKTREKIIGSVSIRSDYVRNHFCSKQEELSVDDYIELITSAPISIKRKVELLELLSDENIGSEDREIVLGCIQAANEAMRELQEINRNKSCLQLIAIDTDSEIAFEPYIMDAVPVADYEHALEYIREEFFDPEDDENDSSMRYEFYFKLVLYDIDDAFRMKERTEYVCDSFGEIQYIRDARFLPRVGTQHYIDYFSNHGPENTDTPFKSGDILYIDCRPYLSPAYCLVYYTTPELPCDCCSLRCYYLNSHGLVAEGALKHGHFGAIENPYSAICYMSPLYRAEIYEGELPEEYRFMVDVSKQLKANSELGKKLDSLSDEFFIKPQNLLQGFVHPACKSKGYEIPRGMSREKFVKWVEGINNTCTQK